MRLATPVPDSAAAQASVAAAISIQNERECACDLAWSHLVLAKVLAVKDDHEEAGAVLGVARDMFDTMNIERGREMRAAAGRSFAASRVAAGAAGG